VHLGEFLDNLLGCYDPVGPIITLVFHWKVICDGTKSTPKPHPSLPLFQALQPLPLQSPSDSLLVNV